MFKPNYDKIEGFKWGTVVRWYHTSGQNKKRNPSRWNRRYHYGGKSRMRKDIANETWLIFTIGTEDWLLHDWDESYRDIKIWYKISLIKNWLCEMQLVWWNLGQGVKTEVGSLNRFAAYDLPPRKILQTRQRSQIASIWSINHTHKKCKWELAAWFKKMPEQNSV